MDDRCCRTPGFSFGAKFISKVSKSDATDSERPASAADVPKAAIIPTDLDGELTQQLHKLSKRDATTKVKALQVSP
jgi:hypothetical protein